MAQSLVIPLAIPLCQFPLFLESLLLTWDPSSCVVRSRPPWSQVARKLTSPSTFPPHSNFPTPQGFRKSIVRPTKMTSRSRLHIVRNSMDMDIEMQHWHGDATWIWRCSMDTNADIKWAWTWTDMDMDRNFSEHRRSSLGIHPTWE